MPPAVEPFENRTLGARVTAIDLNHLHDGTWRLVEQSFLEHAYLVFAQQPRAQPLRSASPNALLT